MSHPQSLQTDLSRCAEEPNPTSIYVNEITHSIMSDAEPKLQNSWCSRSLLNYYEQLFA